MKCHYHPVQSAENHCAQCRKNFCRVCSGGPKTASSLDMSHTCFICETELEALASANTIEPFWSRIGKIYKYPLSLQALITILIISALSTLLQNWGVLALIPFIALNLYSFACLRSTAAGENEAPDVDASFQGSVGPVFYVIIVMAVAIFAATFVFYSFGNGMGIIASLFLILVMPAALIVIAVKEKLFIALNPATLVGIIKTTGASYFVMVLFILVMMSSMGLVSSVVMGAKYSLFGFFLTSVVANYYGIVIFHIMGYLVYQNHVVLGYRVLGRAGVKESKPQTLKQRQTAQLEVLIKAGKFDAARAVAKQTLSADATLWEWSRAFKLLCAAKPSGDLNRYFERYVDKLSSLDETGKIADAYTELIRVKPDFKFTNDERKLDIAEALHQNGKDAMAIRLVQKLPIESSKHDVVGRSLEILVNGFKRLPGSEKHLAHFQNLQKSHLSRSPS